MQHLFTLHAETRMYENVPALVIEINVLFVKFLTPVRSKVTKRCAFISISVRIEPHSTVLSFKSETLANSKVSRFVKYWLITSPTASGRFVLPPRLRWVTCAPHALPNASSELKVSCAQSHSVIERHVVGRLVGNCVMLLAPERFSEVSDVLQYESKLLTDWSSSCVA